MSEQLPHSVLSAVVDLGGNAHFRQIAHHLQKRSGVFPQELIWTLYGLEKQNFLSSYLVPDPMSEVSGLLDYRVFRMEERGWHALIAPAVLEQCSGLTANPMGDLMKRLKAIREQREVKLESKTLNVLFDEAMDFWRGFGHWLPRPSLRK